MDTLFILSILFFIACFISRKKLAVLFSGHKKKELAVTPPMTGTETTIYKILAYNAKDYPSTKDLEDAMELRLGQCLAGLSRQGHKAEVEFHSTGFVLVYLVKYTY